MAGVEYGSVIVFCPLVQAVATGFAVSHLYPEVTEKLQVTEEGPRAERRLPGALPPCPPLCSWLWAACDKTGMNFTYRIPPLGYNPGVWPLPGVGRRYGV